MKTSRFLKRTVLLFGVAILAGNVMAQQEQWKAVSVGFLAGATYSNMNFNKSSPPPSHHISSSWKAGAAVGLLIDIPITRKLALENQYMFMSQSSVRNDSAITYNLNYLSFPILLKYAITEKLNIIAGPQFDLLINASKRDPEKINITHDTEERGIGITGGLKYRFARHLFVAARYTQGLNHVGIGQRSAVQEYKSELVVATVGFVL